MSTTKRLSVKAEKPQDQTCASPAQKLIDHILADQTTGLSDAIDSAVYNSVVTGTGMVQMGIKNGAITATTTPYIVNTGNSGAVLRASGSGSNPSWSGLSRQVVLKRQLMEADPLFEMTTEQLRAAWMITYGNRWVSLDAIDDNDTNIIMLRLRALGELEVHNVVDQYSPMARIKL